MRLLRRMQFPNGAGSKSFDKQTVVQRDSIEVKYGYAYRNKSYQAARAITSPFNV